MEVNQNTRAAMASIASTIAGAIYASGAAKTEMDLLYIVEQKMLALFPTVESKEILLAVSHSLASLNLYRESLGHFDKPQGGIQ